VPLGSDLVHGALPPFAPDGDTGAMFGITGVTGVRAGLAGGVRQQIERIGGWGDEEVEMRIGHAGDGVINGRRMRRGAANLWLLLLVLPMVGLLVGFLGGVVASYVVARQFESRAVVQVMPATGADALVVSGDAVRQVGPEQFFATESEVIRARKTLERVVEHLDLATRWNVAPDDCVAILKDSVRVGQIRGTDLIEVRVRHASAEDAKLLAEQVVTQYRDRRNEGEMERARKILAAMDENLRRQQEIVDEKRKALDTVVQAVGISIFDPEKGDKLEQEMARIYQAAERNFEELDRERESLELQVKQLVDLNNEELLAYAAGLQLPQNGVTARYEEYRSELVKLHDLQDDGLADAHPRVVAQRVRVDVLRKDLDRAVNILREVLKTQLDLVDSRLGKMRRVLEERRKRTGDQGAGEEDYLIAKRDYEEALAVFQHQKLAQSERRIMAAIPKSPVTIHEMPKIGRNPVTPKVGLYLGGGALGGAALGFVLAVMLGIIGQLAGRSRSST
jgi:uncharacterized protein involved in exopolysaccharide biosynthesis